MELYFNEQWLWNIISLIKFEWLRNIFKLTPDCDTIRRVGFFYERQPRGKHSAEHLFSIIIECQDSTWSRFKFIFRFKTSLKALEFFISNYMVGVENKCYVFSSWTWTSSCFFRYRFRNMLLDICVRWSNLNLPTSKRTRSRVFTFTM